MTDIDHEYTDEVVCPHCGHQHRDSYEFFGSGEEYSEGVQCHRCERLFDASMQIKVSYSTRR